MGVDGGVGGAARQEGPEPVLVQTTLRQQDHFRSVGGGASNRNEMLAVSIVGPLDADALVRAMVALMGRHEVLRSSMVMREDTVWSGIAPTGPEPIPWVDGRGIPSASAERLARWLLDLVEAPFMLTEPLFRWSWYRVKDEEHVLALVLHESICDWITLGILLSDVRALYRWAVTGAAFSAAFARQLGGYAAQQRTFGPHTEVMKRYWTMRGTAPTLQIPDGLAVEDAYFLATRLPMVPPARVDALAAIAKQAGVTTGRAVVALVIAALELYLGDVAQVGLLQHNRGRPVDGRMVGRIADHLPVSVPLDDEITFAQVVADVHAGWKSALPHVAPVCQIRAQLPEHQQAAPLFTVGIEYLPYVAEADTWSPAMDSGVAMRMHRRSLSGVTRGVDGPLSAVVPFDVRLWVGADGWLVGDLWTLRPVLNDPSVAEIKMRFEKAAEVFSKNPDLPIRALRA